MDVQGVEAIPFSLASKKRKASEEQEEQEDDKFAKFIKLMEEHNRNVHDVGTAMKETATYMHDLRTTVDAIANAVALLNAKQQTTTTTTT